MTTYAFDETGMRRAVTSIRKTENQPLDPQRSQLFRSGEQPIKWKFGYNVSGETIPPFSVVAIEAGSVIGGIYHANLNKPSTTFNRFYGITGSLAIAVSGRGGYHTESWLCTYDSGTPAAGEQWGAKPGQWTLSKGYPGIFTIEGLFDSTNKYVIGQCHPISIALVKTVGAHAKGDAQDCTIYAGTTQGSESDSTVDIPNVYNRYIDLDDDVWGHVMWPNGAPELIAGECNP